jgi:hypothetical protein
MPASLRRCEFAPIQNASSFPIRIAICGKNDAPGTADPTCCLEKDSLIRTLEPGYHVCDFLKLIRFRWFLTGAIGAVKGTGRSFV